MYCISELRVQIALNIHIMPKVTTNRAELHAQNVLHSELALLLFSAKKSEVDKVQSKDHDHLRIYGLSGQVPPGGSFVNNSRYKRKSCLVIINRKPPYLIEMIRIQRSMWTTLSQ